MLSKKDTSLLKRLLKYENTKTIAICFTLSLLGFLVAAGGRMGIANSIVMIEKGWDNPNTMWVILVPLYFIAVTATQGLGHVFGSYFLNKVARRIIMCIRSQLLKSLLKKKQSFFDNQPSDSLSSLLIYHVEQVYLCIAGGIISLLKESLSVIFLLGYLLYLNAWFTLIMLIILPIAILLIKFISKRFYILSKNIQYSMEDFGKESVEMIRSIGIIRLYSSVKFQSSSFDKSNKNNYQQNMKLIMTQLLSSPILEMLVAFLMAFMVWLVLSGKTPSQFGSIGSFTAYIIAVGLIGQPIKALSLVMGVIQKGIAAIDRVFYYLDIEEENIDKGISVPRSNGSVVLQNVSMSYGGDVNALNNINLSIKSKTVTAIVGRSGCGKTTLAHILLGFYPISEGKILLDNQDTQDISLRSLRNQFSLVSQNQIFLNGSIARNIAYGDDNIDMDKVRKVAEMAQVSSFAMDMKDGLETTVGENAALLSGGQKQRLSIARALYRDTPILILDEATSALDNQSDHLIQTTLQSLDKNKTIIIIAHKLSNVIHADSIVVLDKGKISQQGTHAELMSVDGLYQNMYKKESRE